MFRRADVLGSIVALAIGLTWLALDVHYWRVLVLVTVIPTAPPMGLAKFWLYCGVMGAMYVVLVAGAYLEGSGRPLVGRILSCTASCTVAAGTAFFILAPDQFWDLYAIPPEDKAMVVLGIVSAVAAVASTIAAFTADQPASVPPGAARSLRSERGTMATRALSEQP